MAEPNWDSGDFSVLVPVNSNKLSFSVSGPHRHSGSPLVIILPGLGSTTLEWVAVTSQLSSFVRTLTYDRPGYVNSTTPDIGPTSTASTTAAELNQTLEIAGIKGPYIIVCHSWGGITSREFLELRSADVAGMVFVDANQERTVELPNWHCPEIFAMTKGVQYHDVVGLTAGQKLGKANWDKVLAEEQRPEHQSTEQSEMAGIPESYETLRTKYQLKRDPPMLGDRPVSVLKGNCASDFQKLYDAGVAAGNGTEHDREVMRELVAGWNGRDLEMQKEQLGLSSKGRITCTEMSGHNIQLTEPELIVEEVKWVLETWRGKASSYVLT